MAPREKQDRTRLQLHLRRLPVDEALFRLETFLNRAFLARTRRVWIVHGKGTGTLCQAVRAYLAAHPLVYAYQPGEGEEGGAGVTVVELAL